MLIEEVLRPAIYKGSNRYSDLLIISLTLVTKSQFNRPMRSICFSLGCNLCCLGTILFLSRYVTYLLVQPHIHHKNKPNVHKIQLVAALWKVEASGWDVSSSNFSFYHGAAKNWIILMLEFKDCEVTLVSLRCEAPWRTLKPLEAPWGTLKSLEAPDLSQLCGEPRGSEVAPTLFALVLVPFWLTKPNGPDCGPAPLEPFKPGPGSRLVLVKQGCFDDCFVFGCLN